jgi:GNAT superfamily N-acetyltransferase
MTTIRRFEGAEWEAYRAVRLSALADSPNAYYTTLEEAEARTPASWSEQLSAGASSRLDLPLVALAEGQQVGLAWGKITPPDLESVYVLQMWVHPSHRRTGLGKRLLGTIVDWSRKGGASCVRLRVTRGNAPALQLYQGVGFEDDGEPVPLRPGSEIKAQDMCLKL